MTEWKESDKKVIIIDRNLTLLNHTIESVSGKDMYVQLNFAENDHISVGGINNPDHI